MVIIYYSDALQNAPRRSQIFTIFFASGEENCENLTASPPSQNPADALERTCTP